MSRKILIGVLIAIITAMVVFFSSTVYFRRHEDASPVYNSGQDSTQIRYYESEELLSLDCGMSIEITMLQACDNKEYGDIYIWWLESGAVEYIGSLGRNNIVSYRASMSGQCMLVSVKEDGNLENITKQLDIAYADIDFGEK